jgi:hypothetical protein
MNSEFPVAYQPGTLVEIPGIWEKGIVVRHSLTQLAGPGTFYKVMMIDGVCEGEVRLFSGDSPVAVEYTVEQKPESEQTTDILETTFVGPMTGFEFTYRIGRRAAQTMRRFGWNIEEATARFQRDMDESSPKPVTIVSVVEIGYDAVMA